VQVDVCVCPTPMNEAIGHERLITFTMEEMNFLYPELFSKDTNDAESYGPYALNAICCPQSSSPSFRNVQSGASDFSKSSDSESNKRMAEPTTGIENKKLKRVDSQSSAIHSVCSPTPQSPEHFSAEEDHRNNTKAIDSALVGAMSKIVAHSLVLPGTNNNKKNIGMEKLVNLLVLPVNDAAKALDVSPTTFKTRCRELGIAKWPFRRFQAIRNIYLYVAETFKTVADSYSSSLKAMSESVRDDIQLSMMALTVNKFQRDLKTLKDHAEAMENHFMRTSCVESLVVPKEVKRIFAIVYKHRYHISICARKVSIPSLYVKDDLVVGSS
jgi:hypothetical protein